MKLLRIFTLLPLAAALLACGGQVEPRTGQSDAGGKSSSSSSSSSSGGATEPRKLLSSLVFADEFLTACVKHASSNIEYVDQLKSLGCETHGALVEGFTGGPGSTVFSTQGLEQLTALEELDLGNNHIESIDISKLPKLRVLDLSSNPISQVDTSKNPLLTSLHMGFLFTSYPSEPLNLDLSNNVRLESLQLRVSNRVILPASPNLAELKMTLAADLKSIGKPAATTTTYRYGEAGYEVDLSAYPKLKTLSLTGPIHGVTLPTSETLESLDVLGGSTLSSIDVTRTPNLKHIALTLADNLTNFDLTHASQLTDLQLKANGLTQLSLVGVTRLTNLQLSADRLPQLSLANLSRLTSLVLNANALPQLSLADLPQLTSLQLNANALQQLSLADLPQLTSLLLNANALPQLNLAGAPQLDVLNIASSDFTQLIGLTASKLTSLSIETPQLKQLDASSTLKQLKVNFTNRFAGLDFKAWPNLTDLTLTANELQQLDLANATQLGYLAINSTSLVQLSGLAATKLTELDLQVPKLQQLDLTGATGIKSLSLGAGRLQTLTGLAALQPGKVSIGDNQLSRFDTPLCDGLFSLTLGNNPISSLDLHTCKQLSDLWLGNLPIKSLDLRESHNLVFLNLYNIPLARENLQLSDGFPTILTYLAPQNHQTVAMALESVPDLKLHSCLLQAAQAAGVTYASDLKTLNCAGKDSKPFWQSTWEYQQVQAGTARYPLYSLPDYVFSLAGIYGFQGLESIDLNTNWIANADELAGLPHLKTLNLESNVIQSLDMDNNPFSPSLESLNISSNPLRKLYLPGSLKSLKANSGVSAGYTVFALSDHVDIPRMKNDLTGMFLWIDDYLGIPPANNLNELFNLIDIQSGRR